MLHFANSQLGWQLFFLITNDITGYKLATNLCDLTAAQIEFYRICAEKVHEEIEKAKNSANNMNNSSSDSSFKIDTTKDSPEEIRNKLDMMKAGMR